MFQRSAVVAVSVASFLLSVPGSPASALEPCVTNCATIEVGEAEVPIRGGAGEVSITFNQGPNDGQSQQGNDDVAALAFTVGLPGDGSGNPLVFECNGGALESGAISRGPDLGSGFALIVENESCNARTRCLCPEGGQTRDNFVNLVIYGPADLPNGGPVEIPRLPSGELVTLSLLAGDGVSEQQMFDLPVYCEQDDPTRPQFTANLSIGDQSAIDQTADRPNDESRINCTAGKVTIGAEIVISSCAGDCDGNGTVAINELILAVNIALGNQPLSNCQAADANGNGSVAINELIIAVNNALNGCPS